MLSLVNKRIPLYFLIIAVLIFSAVIFLHLPVHLNDAESDTADVNTTFTEKTFEVRRLEGYNYIAPILFVETKNKSDRYVQLQQQVQEYINGMKATHVINDAAFYFRDISNSEWTGLNEDQNY